MFPNTRFVWVKMPTNQRMPKSLNEKRKKIITEIDELFIPIAWVKETRDFMCLAHLKTYIA